MLCSHQLMYTKHLVKLLHALFLCFYPRPVLALGYCRSLCLCVCLSVCVSITNLSAEHPFKPGPNHPPGWRSLLFCRGVDRKMALTYRLFGHSLNQFEIIVNCNHGKKFNGILTVLNYSSSDKLHAKMDWAKWCLFCSHPMCWFRFSQPWSLHVLTIKSVLT